MVLLTTFPDYKAAESALEKYLQRNTDVIGALQGFSVEERKQAGVENPLAEPGKELTLLVDLFWFADDSYNFIAGIRTLSDDIVDDSYPTMKDFASAVKSRLQWFQRGEGSHLYGRIPDSVMVPFLYTVDNHDIDLPELSDEEKKEAKEEIMGGLKDTPPDQQQEMVQFLEVFFGKKPAIRGLTAEEQEEFVKEYEKL